jgi:hypothetical protein
LLLQSGIPDPEIEELLCAELHRIYGKCDSPWRSEILAKLVKYGSTACLGTLEAVEYEFASTYQTAILALKYSSSESLGEEFLYGLEKQAQVEFGAKLVEAIRMVREAARMPHPQWGAAATSLDDPFQR